MSHRLKGLGCRSQLYLNENIQSGWVVDGIVRWTQPKHFNWQFLNPPLTVPHASFVNFLIYHVHINVLKRSFSSLFCESISFCTSANSDVLQEQMCEVCLSQVTCFTSYWFLAMLHQALQIGAFIQFGSAQFNTSLLNPCTANCKWQLATRINRKTHRWEEKKENRKWKQPQHNTWRAWTQVEKRLNYIERASPLNRQRALQHLQSLLWVLAFSFIVFLLYQGHSWGSKSGYWARGPTNIRL